jgi:hypothetical protein
MNLAEMKAEIDHDQNRDRNCGQNAKSLPGHAQILRQSLDASDHR